jgi:hypothetical protein
MGCITKDHVGHVGRSWFLSRCATIARSTFHGFAMNANEWRTLLIDMTVITNHMKVPIWN